MTDSLETNVRASDAERQSTSKQLQAACVEGRLTLEEFSNRVERALVSQTRAQLHELTSDLPTNALVPATEPPARSTTTVIMSDTERRVYRLDEPVSVLVAFGTCKLDLRQATIASQVSVLDVRVYFGSLEIIVPEGVEVDAEALTVMSNKTMRLRTTPLVPTAPRIQIRGRLIASALNIKDDRY